MIPRATYRLQFCREFPFADAIPLVHYFARLGISHIYASPILAARQGSAHGYDVIDHSRINPELGGEDGFRALVAALREHGLGIIVDIVPNHMAVDGGNAWWMDVLEHGRESAYARTFDIEWDPSDPSLHNRLLVPILGRPFSEALSDGEITLGRDNSGRTAVCYFDHRLPLRPEDARLLATAPLEQFRSPDAMAALLDRQHYRLAWWRTAGDLINWRRFFDINDLIALRVEDDGVFNAVHAKHLALYGEGLIDGFRVDHVDGLAEPDAYCRKLRARMKALREERGYLVVEKILASAEQLPGAWDVDGTSGYDFMNDVSALLHDAEGAGPLAGRWAAISGRPFDFDAEERRARRERLDVKFRGAFEAAACAFLAARPRQARDMTLASLKRALARLYAQLRMYRSYASGDADSPATGELFAEALERARYRAPENDSAALTHIVETLEGRATAPAEKRKHAARRFNQLAASLAAKAGEDTAFYRYGRLLSRNEVGADPGELAISPAEFHLRAQRRLGSASLLATATHDHKRGEDVRARLAVLSEITDEWSAAVDRWFRLNARLRDPQLDPGDEYQLYQTLVGSWPLDLAGDDRPALSDFSGRILGWRLKSLHEEKIHTSWGDPDARYDRASGAFVRQLLDPACSAEFLRDLANFVQRIAPAAALNSFSQTALKCTCPGIPDFYQGTELWDLSMVDPDNRRPVDFGLRNAAFASDAPLPALLAGWRNGFVKQRLIADLLRLRARHDNVFRCGDYVTLRTAGSRKDNVVAFMRSDGNFRLLIAVPRLCARPCIQSGAPLPGREFWGDTKICLPGDAVDHNWRDPLALPTAAKLPALHCAALFARYPAAVLISGEQAKAP